uniref:Uncharacterized protein n=1 Tax=Picea sitchensis TaxID=3332 RepID=D5A9L3_PICSI|nr:unknown [Picea sitchensis]
MECHRGCCRGMRLHPERCWRWSVVEVCDFSKGGVGCSTLDNGMVGNESGESRAREKARVAGGTGREFKCRWAATRTNFID